MIYYFLGPVLFLFFLIIDLVIELPDNSIVSAIIQISLIYSILVCLLSYTDRRNGTIQMSRNQFATLVMIVIADIILTIIIR